MPAAEVLELIGKFKEILGTLSDVAGLLGKAAKGLAAPLVNTVEAGMGAIRGAQRTSMPVEAYQQLQYAAQRSGVQAETFQSAMSSLATAAYQVKPGSAEAEAFARLKVDLGKPDQLRPLNEILEQLVDAFGRMPEGVQKAALTVKIFGESTGPAMLPFLDRGKEGLKKLTQEARDFGLVFEDRTRGKTLDSIEKLASLPETQRAAMAGFERALVVSKLPDLAAKSEEFSRFIQENHHVIRELVNPSGAAGAEPDRSTLERARERLRRTMDVLESFREAIRQLRRLLPPYLPLLGATETGSEPIAGGSGPSGIPWAPPSLGTGSPLAGLSPAAGLLSLSMPVSVQMEINAAPGQSATEIGREVASSLRAAIEEERQSWLSQAYASVMRA